jgi:MYXO-CTERM domain-containing protein
MSEAQAATPQYYDDLMTFQTDVTFTVTDDYSNPGYMFINTDAAMSAVIGETDYMTTGFMNLNIVSGGAYCAGCNGSFQLSFTTTSVGTNEGVNGVGFDVTSNDMMNPYFAYIVFADGDTANVQLPFGGSFWGVFASERIVSIDVGLSGGGATMGGYFTLDNLIVGDGFDMTPCGDGIVTPDEDCDDVGESVTCDSNCTFASCGDGTINDLAGEICDDMGASMTCDDDCTDAACGDGTVNMAAGETCDEMIETATCNVDCTIPVCGDGVPNTLAGEECDDSAESPACDPDCTLPVCGDGYENNTAGEYCDDGNMTDGDGCSSTCTIEEGGSSSGGGSSESGGSEGGSTGGSETTDGGTSGGGEDVGSSGEGADTSGGEGGSEGATTLTTTASAESEGGGGESSGGASGGGNTNDSSGCGCTTESPRGAAWSLLLLAGAVARRRRSV